ncbi:hypothetical protein VKT23_008758 [Stygiomarasmius scandens]|uniref:Uncharacterized protein n=1 Tax=Marasmiellus scandens TaxID=2682957 RepID=A0ABR1JI21_9AGAR
MVPMPPVNHRTEHSQHGYPYNNRIDQGLQYRCLCVDITAISYLDIGASYPARQARSSSALTTGAKGRRQPQQALLMSIIRVAEMLTTPTTVYLLDFIPNMQRSPQTMPPPLLARPKLTAYSSFGPAV